MPEEAGAATEALHFSIRHLRAGRSLVLEGGLLKSLYFVRAGCFKCFQTQADGDEQVHRFPVPGDVIGFDGLDDGCYASGAVALEESQVVVMPFRELLRLGHELPALERLLHRCAGREVVGRERKMQVLQATGEEARLARFLWQWAQEQDGCGRAGKRLPLPMSRRDIASHLGLSREAVCRALSVLEEAGCIALGCREIELLDAVELDRRQRGAQSEAATQAHPAALS